MEHLRATRQATGTLREGMRRVLLPAVVSNDESRHGWRRPVDAEAKLSKIHDQFATAQLKIIRTAVVTIQRRLRKHWWLRMVRNIGGGGIRLHQRGHCGVSLFPVRRLNGTLIEYQGRSGRRPLWTASDPTSTTVPSTGLQ